MTGLTVFTSVLLLSIIVIQSKKFLIEVEEDKENSTVKTVESKKDDCVMRYHLSDKISHITY